MRGAGGAVLASGGQYDRLLERLGATAPIAASGCALWVDRLEAEHGPEKRTPVFGQDHAQKGGTQ